MPVAMLPLTADYDPDRGGGGEGGEGGGGGGGNGSKRATTRRYDMDLLQMVEALSAAMMGQRDALEGLPVR